ncbi:hypothetical protein COU77_00015 [Candidatus Peregrinibacteria bacterium CG10_big_fil_rev_8_21_14_0_10_49_16]|nr:MAG: hypothetical protein COU77_00015 [Candidatus Peregrinibacteria bacterium CG10_big_fil_rev_8_21_14_0_10_49_16]
MPIELTPVQKTLAETLSVHAKDACALVGLKCQKCEPHHFYLTVHRYYGKVQGMTAEMDRCIDWCMSKGKLVFTAQRFGNWCAKKVKWDREQEIRQQELMTLKSGTEHQKADYRRQVSGHSSVG